MAKADVEIRVGVDDKATTKLKGIGASMTRMSGTFKKAGLGMMAAGAALGASLFALTKLAIDFEMAMREVNTMIGLSQDGFEQLSDAVRDLSVEVGKSTTELSGALYQIVSAGIAAADAIYVLEVASKAAVAGVTDVKTAADGLTTILNAFKISSKDAGKVADVMFTVVKRGKTNFAQLSAALFQVAPIAASAGVKFEEVAAAIATITKQGVPTKVATVQLRQAIQGIIKPSDDMKRAISDMGFASGEAMLQELGLARTLNMVRDSAGGSLDNLGRMFGSVEALQGVLAVTGQNAATFSEDLIATTENAAGAVETAYDEMNKGVGRQFELLFNELKVMGEELGATLLPILKSIVENVLPIVKGIKEWVDMNPALAKGLLAIAVAMFGLGTALVAVNIAMAVFHGLTLNWVALAAGTAAGIAMAAGMFGIMGGFSGEEKTSASGQVTPFASGGIVTSPTMAMIGEAGPEAVVPLGKGLGSSLTINVGNFIGDETSIRKFARMIKEVIGEDDRRNAFGGVSGGYFFGRSSI